MYVPIVLYFRFREHPSDDVVIWASELTIHFGSDLFYHCSIFSKWIYGYDYAGTLILTSLFVFFILAMIKYFNLMRLVIQS